MNITNLTWSEGQHNVTIWANDSANNLNWSSISFTIDTTPPTFDNLVNKTQRANISFYFDVDATDEQNGIENFVLNNTNFFSIDSTTGVITNNTNLSRVEIYWLKINVSDAVGNDQETEFFINITESTGGDIRNLFRLVNNESKFNVTRFDGLGNLYLLGNIETDGCIKYNCAQPGGCVTLGICV